MTASEIKRSGIDEASKFTVTLKDGNAITFWSDLPNQNFFTFNPTHNTLQSYIYFDAKGRHDNHITIKGDDIVSIKVLISKEEGQRIHNNWEVFSYLALAAIILIGLYKACH